MNLTEKKEQLIRQIETGEYLLKLRNEKGISLAKVGETLKVSSNYLSEIERGLRIPSDHLIRTIADFYNINENDLFRRFGKIPLTAREELEGNETLQKALSEIRSNPNLTEEHKQSLYDELFKLYKDLLKELN